MLPYYEFAFMRQQKTLTFIFFALLLIEQLLESAMMYSTESVEREDYHEDHLRRLGRSHSMTMANLEQGAFEKDSDVAQKPTVRDQIVPTKDALSWEDRETIGRQKRRHSISTMTEIRDGEVILREFRRHSGHNVESTLPNDVLRSRPGLPEVHSISSKSEDSSHQRSSPRTKFRRTASLFSVVAALAAATVFLALPATRKVLDRALGEMIKGTGQVFAYNSQQIAPVLPMLSLDETQLPNYDTLLAPVYSTLTDNLPLFWMIPNSGSRTARDVLSYCMKLVISDERGALHLDSKVRDSYA